MPGASARAVLACRYSPGEPHRHGVPAPLALGRSAGPRVPTPHARRPWNARRPTKERTVRCPRATRGKCAVSGPRAGWPACQRRMNPHSTGVGSPDSASGGIRRLPPGARSMRHQPAHGRRAADMSHTQFGRIERGELGNLTVDQARGRQQQSACASLKTYPDGDPARDADIWRSLERFHRRLPRGPFGERRCRCRSQETAGLGTALPFLVGGELDANVRRAFAMSRRSNAGSR